MMEILFFCFGFSMGIGVEKLTRWLVIQYRVRKFMASGYGLKLELEEKAEPITPANEQPADKLRAEGEYIRVYDKDALKDDSVRYEKERSE